MGFNHPNRTVLRGSLVVPAEELLVREHHARQVQGLQVPFATGREHAHALQHVTAKVQPCQAVLRCQSWPALAINASSPQQTTITEFVADPRWPRSSPTSNLHGLLLGKAVLGRERSEVPMYEFFLTWVVYYSPLPAHFPVLKVSGFCANAPRLVSDVIQCD